MLTLSYLFPEKGQVIPLLVAYDGQLALLWVKAKDPLSLTEPHYNLISAIQNLESQMAFTVQWWHVKVHQDGKTITVLPCKAWLNIKVDMAAKLALGTKSHTNLSTRYDVPFSAWVCYVRTRRVFKQFSCTVCMHLSSPTLEKYWKEKQFLLQCQWAESPLTTHIRNPWLAGNGGQQNMPVVNLATERI